MTFLCNFDAPQVKKKQLKCILANIWKFRFNSKLGVCELLSLYLPPRIALRCGKLETESGTVASDENFGLRYRIVREGT